MSEKGGKMGKSWADFYKGICCHRETLEGNILVHAPLITEVARCLQPGGRVLEVGSGTGVLGWPLAQGGVSVVSLDNDSGVLELCELNAAFLGADIEYVLGDAFNIPYSDGEFDVAFSGGLLEHFPDTEIHKLVNEQLRVAKAVVTMVPLKGAGGVAFGNERWLTRGEWQHIFDPYNVVAEVLYEHNNYWLCTAINGRVKVA